MSAINLIAKALFVYIGLASFMCSLTDLTSSVSRQYFSIRIGLMTQNMITIRKNLVPLEESTARYMQAY